MRILLVEDDPTTSKSIELMLTHANLNVYATDLGEEGIDLAKLYDYDLILLDLNLPDIDGHEVLRQLRMARIGTPILILSGATTPRTRSRVSASAPTTTLPSRSTATSWWPASTRSSVARRGIPSRSSTPARSR